MRIGQNPAKFVDSVPTPARVTAVVITYIPFLGGYYAQSLDVLKACLTSMRAHTNMPYDLLVFDNASCEEVRAYLQNEHAAGRIQYLTLSQENLGKAGAWNFAFAAAPSEIIAYADADIYFEKGWLEKLVAVLETYPAAGMLTGIPMWSPEEFSTATVQWAETTEGVDLQRGKLLPWKDYWKHARSLGQSEEAARSNFNQQTDLAVEDHRRFQVPGAEFQVPEPAPDTERGTRNPERFFVGAGHFQFLARKAVLSEVLPIPADRPMGQVRRLDAAINEAGYLRLSTPDWWIRHMGNTLEGTVTTSGGSSRETGRVLRGPLRRFVQWLYHKTFDMLYRS